MNVTIDAWSFWEPTEEMPRGDVSFVPALMRRRLTELERGALYVAHQVKISAESPVVFASNWGEIGVTAKLLTQFEREGEMSPAGFSVSVHNAVPGILSILTKNQAPYTAIAAGERSLEQGLLEAFTYGAPEILFIYAEESLPAMYHTSPAAPHLDACALALRVNILDEGAWVLRFENQKMPPLTPHALISFLKGEKPDELSTSCWRLASHA